MLTLHQLERSPFCDKVRRILRFKGVPFEVREVSLFAGKQHSPTGKLPALDLHGELLDDSTQIAYALERHYPEPRLIPLDPAQRALCHVLEDWADESLYFYEMALHFSLEENSAARIEKLAEQETPLKKALAKQVLPGLLRMSLVAQGTGRRTRERILEDVGRHMQAIADLLGDRAYLVGSDITLADIAVCCQLGAMLETEQGRRLCAQHPSVASFRSRVLMRTGG